MFMGREAGGTTPDYGNSARMHKEICILTGWYLHGFIECNNQLVATNVFVARMDSGGKLAVWCATGGTPGS